VASPKGDRLIFSETFWNSDIVSVDLAKAEGKRLMATEMDDSMPSWAARQPVMAYVTFRNGPQEIWLRGPGDTDRPVVQAKDNPGENWLMGPALSPDADRVIYTRVGRGQDIRLWISATAGGAPVPLTNETGVAELPGSWSPDGNWF